MNKDIGSFTCIIRTKVQEMMSICFLDYEEIDESKMNPPQEHISEKQNKTTWVLLIFPLGGKESNT